MLIEYSFINKIRANTFSTFYFFANKYLLKTPILFTIMKTGSIYEILDCYKTVILFFSVHFTHI